MIDFSNPESVSIALENKKVSEEARRCVTEARELMLRLDLLDLVLARPQAHFYFDTSAPQESLQR